MRRNRVYEYNLPIRWLHSDGIEWIASYLVPVSLSLWNRVLAAASFGTRFISGLIYWRKICRSQFRKYCVRSSGAAGWLLAGSWFACDMMIMFTLSFYYCYVVVWLRLLDARHHAFASTLTIYLILRSSRFASSPSSLSSYCCRPMEMILYDGSDRIG